MWPECQVNMYSHLLYSQLPETRAHFALVVINNVLYALGGQFREMTDVRNTVFVWSRDLRTCNRSARVIPEAMDGMGYAVIPA